MNVVIRPATEGDIETIYAISCAVHLGPLYKQLITLERYGDFVERFTPNPDYFAETYQPRIKQRLADPEWFYWVAEVDGIVCGFTLARQTDDVLELKGLFVDEIFQGQGIGKQLFETSCSIARPGQTILLEVISENKRAIDIYVRQGFEQTDETPKPFFDTPMIRMEKH